MLLPLFQDYRNLVRGECRKADSGDSLVSVSGTVAKPAGKAQHMYDKMMEKLHRTLLTRPGD